MMETSRLETGLDRLPDRAPRISFAQRWALALSLLLLPASSALGVELQPGQTYAGGTTLTASLVGITISVPAGWQAQLPEGTEALVMVRADQQAYVVLVADQATRQGIVTEMAAAIDLGDGIVMHPQSPPRDDETGMLTADYRVSGTQRPAEGRIWARIGPHGLGVMFTAVDTSGAIDGPKGAGGTAKRLAESIQFAAPVAPVQPASGGEGALPWQDYMRGRYIARFFSGSGYHEKTEIWLCSDGRFQRSGDAGGYGGGASGAWAGGGAGRWSASGSQPGAGELKLQFEDGVSTYALSLTGGKLYLDGTQWLRGDNELCN